MRLVKRAICVLVVIFVIMACVPMSAFATGDVVEFTEAAKLGASIVDLYGMANNTNLAYDVASNQSALTVIENLYTEYSSNASDPYTLAAIGAAAAAAGAIAVIYDAVTGQGYIQLYQEQYISSLDGYWDYQLTDAGLVRDSLSGLFNWTLNQQDTVTPIVIFQSNSVDINGFEVFVPPLSFQKVLTGYIYTFSTSSPDTYYYLAEKNDGSSNGVVFFCPQNNSAVVNMTWTRIDNGNVDINSNFIVDSSNYSYAGQYFRLLQGGSDYLPQSLTIYTSDTNNNNYWYPEHIFGSFSSSDILTVSDNYSLSPYWGDPLEQPLEITIPDNASPDYVPVPRRITTTMPVPEGVDIPLPDGVDTPEYGVPYPITDPATLNAIVPELWDDLVADDVGLRDAPDPDPAPDPAPDPSEVFVPLLPVTLPSFNFNFSGIWHYVRDWVASLGAWFSMVFTVWSNLPYAIVVPVYATAVIVVVLGVYKRFFM